MCGVIELFLWLWGVRYIIQHLSKPTELDTTKNELYHIQFILSFSIKERSLGQLERGRVGREEGKWETSWGHCNALGESRWV